MAYKLTKTQLGKFQKYRSGLKRLRRKLSYMSRTGRIDIKKSSSSLRQSPDLVLPRLTEKDYEFTSREDYEKVMSKLSRYQDLNSYVRNSYKKEILKLWRNKISDTALDIYDTPVVPDGRGGRTFSQEQEQYFSEISEYMKMYNKLERMSGEKFMNLYYSGYIIPFKEIYRELSKTGKRGSYDKNENMFLEKQKDVLKELSNIGAIKPTK